MIFIGEMFFCRANPFGFANDNEKMTSTIKASAQLFYHLDIFDSKKIAMNAVGPVTYICDKLEQVVGFFQVYFISLISFIYKSKLYHGKGLTSI